MTAQPLDRFGVATLRGFLCVFVRRVRAPRHGGATAWTVEHEERGADPRRQQRAHALPPTLAAEEVFLAPAPEVVDREAHQ